MSRGVPEALSSFLSTETMRPALKCGIASQPRQATESAVCSANRGLRYKGPMAGQRESLKARRFVDMAGVLSWCGFLSLLAKHTEKCLKAKLAAFRRAEEVLIPHIGVKFRISEFSGRATAAIAEHWEPTPRHPDSRWDWTEIMRRHRDPDRLDFAIWDDEEKLCAAGLGLTGGASLMLRFFEGSPRMDCKLKGRRISGRT